MRKLVRLAMAVVAGVCLVSVCGSGQCRAQENRPEQIAVAMANNSAPFYFVDAKGSPAGWLVDLWKLWSRETGVKVKFIPAPFFKTLEMIKDGTVDAHAGLFYSKERSNFVNYACPLIKTGTSIFFHQNLYGINNLNDLKGLLVGVVKGDYSEEYLDKKRPGFGVSIIRFKTNREMILAAKEGRIKAFVADTPMGAYFLKKYDLENTFKYLPDRPLYTSKFFAAVKKGEPGLVALVENGFAKIDERQRNELKRRWSGSAQKVSGNLITIAADRNFPPFTWLTDSGRPAGILIDLWRLWSTKTGKRVEFVFGDWSETMEYLKDGRAMVHAGLFKAKDSSAYLGYSLPLIPVEVDLFYREKDGLPDLTAMQGKKIGILLGTGFDSRLERKIPRATLVGFTNYPDLLQALAQGKVDCVVDAGISITFALRSMGLSSLVARYPEPMASRNLYGGVAKSDQAALALVNEGLAEIPKEMMIELESHWVLDPRMRRYKQLALALNLTEEEKDWLGKHKDIRLGVDLAYLPFEGLDSNGSYLGISADYVALLNKKLGLDMEPGSEDSREQVLDNVRSGNIDVVPSASPTKKLSEYLLFTRPYATFPNVVMTRSDNPLLSGLKELIGYKVAVIRGFAVQEYLQKHYLGIELVLVDGVEEGLRAVEEGQAKAYVGLLPSITYYMNKAGLKGLKVSATTKYMHRFSFGVRKDWPQLQTILEKALQSISKEEHERIASRWVNLQVSRETDWETIISGVVASTLAVGVILAVIITWNRRMAREVSERKAAEERFNRMAANVPGAIFQVVVHQDGSRRWLYLSGGAEDFFGVSPDAVVAGNLHLEFHPEDRERVAREIDQAFRNRLGHNTVGRIVVPGGAVRWIRIKASPTPSSQGKTLYNGFILDITERKLAEMEYLASERKVKAMSQAVEDALIMVDSRGAVLFWNPAAERIFGYSEEEALGMDFHTMAAPEEAQDRIRPGLEHFARTGEGAILGTTTETTARKRNGDLFPVEVTLSSFQLDGQWYAVGTVRDISERKKAEAEIRQSREDFRIIADYTFDWEAWHNKDGKLLWVNPAVERITGRTVEECMAMPDYPLPFIHPEDRHIWLESLERAKKAQIGANVSFRIFHKNGAEYWIALSWNPVFSSEGEFTGFRTSAEDFTERKEAEEALKKSEKHTKKILETTRDGFWFVDNNGYTLDVNQAMCGILGRPKGDVVGRPASDFYDEENLKILKKQLRLRAQLEETSYEISVSRPDGSQVICLFSATPFLDDTGRKTGSFAMVSDITEKKRAEDNLKESEERSRLILASAGEGIFGVDTLGRVSFINPTALGLLGFDEKDILGKRVHDLIHHSNSDGSCYPLESCPMYEAYTAGAAHQVASEVLWRKDGEHFPVEYSSTPIINEDRLMGAVITFRDITQRLEAERELKQNLEELERFSRLVVGRELKMIALKEEINGLLRETGRDEKYKIVE